MRVAPLRRSTHTTYPPCVRGGGETAHSTQHTHTHQTSYRHNHPPPPDPHTTSSPHHHLLPTPPPRPPQNNRMHVASLAKATSLEAESIAQRQKQLQEQAAELLRGVPSEGGAKLPPRPSTAGASSGGGGGGSGTEQHALPSAHVAVNPWTAPSGSYISRSNYTAAGLGAFTIPLMASRYGSRQQQHARTQHLLHAAQHARSTSLLVLQQHLPSHFLFPSLPPSLTSPPLDASAPTPIVPSTAAALLGAPPHAA